MSYQALSWASKQKVGNATGKAILLLLANRCNNDDFSCFPSQKNIAEECECGIRTVVSWLQKLEQMGLLLRERRHREDGSRTSDRITLSVGEDLSANNAHAGNARASDDNPTCKCCIPLTSQGNISSSLRSEDNCANPEKSDQPENFKREFETEFWPQYPKNRDKAKALTAFKAARRRASLKEIMAGVHRYAAERDGGDPKFTKYPHRWLQNDCWMDEPEPPPDKSSPQLSGQNWAMEYLLNRNDENGHADRPNKQGDIIDLLPNGAGSQGNDRANVRDFETSERPRSFTRSGGPQA